MSVGKFFKDAGHTISQGSKTITNVFTGGTSSVTGAVGTVYHDGTSAVSTLYKDGRSAVSFAGKHAINDVDTLANAISNPLMWIVVGGVIIVVLANR